MAVGKESILRASNAGTKTEEKNRQISQITTKEKPVSPIIETKNTGVLVEKLTVLDKESKSDDEWIWRVEDSIIKYGILEPLIIWEKPDDKLVVIDGEKRLRAAKKLKMKEVPVFIVEADTEKQARQIRKELQGFKQEFRENHRFKIISSIRSDMPVHLL